jgi:hypothetical protein
VVTFRAESKLSTIGEGCFGDCSSLTSICIPASVEVLSAAAFADCESLSGIAFERGSKLRELGDSLFCECPLEAISIPPSVESIGDCCFLYCGALSTLVIEPGSKLSRIGDGFLGVCMSLSLVCIPSCLPASVVDELSQHIDSDVTLQIR